MDTGKKELPINKAVDKGDSQGARTHKSQA